MPQIIVTSRPGESVTLEAQPGETLMQTITGAGIGELLALCGGMCSCATCHVYVDEHFLNALPALDPDEDALLSASAHRRANSRLSCQIRLSPALEGLKVTIAPQD